MYACVLVENTTILITATKIINLILAMVVMDSRLTKFINSQVG